MTFFRRLRRLRRPIASCVLVLSLFAFIPPSPSQGAGQAVAAGGAAIIAGGALRIIAPAAARQVAQSAARPVAQAMARQYARSAGWGAARSTGATTTVGTVARVSGSNGGTFVGFFRNLTVGAKKLWNWIKKHPGDAADIAGTVLDLIQALRGNGNDKLADAVEHALQPKTSSGPGEEVGDRVDQCDGVYELIYKNLYWWSCCSNYELYDNLSSDCLSRSKMIDAGDQCLGTCTNGHPQQKWTYKYKKISDNQTPSPDSNKVPDELTEEQADRLLDKIEELLRDHKEEMEKDLDDLIKKNLEDIDWPEFDNDAAKQYLRDNKRDDLLDELEKTEQELERKRQERENNQNDPECNNQQDCQNDCNDQTNCQSKCCTTVDCEESRLENKIDRLKDKLDDLDKEEQKENLDETYEAPPPAETELKSIDFQPIVDLKGEFMTKFPFNTLQLIPSAVQLLAAEPQAPSFVIDLGDVGGQHTVDFSVFDSLASFVRLTLTFLIYLAAVFCCLKIWSRL